MTNINFIHSVSGQVISFHDSLPIAGMVRRLSRIDNTAVHASSLGHILAGHRDTMGNWRLETRKERVAPNYNTTDRTQSTSASATKALPKRSDALARLEAAYQIALQTNNRRLAATLLPMINKEKARSIKSTTGTDFNERPSRRVRTCTNPRTMAKKLKRELADNRIELATPEVIAELRAAHVQRCRVFARG